jgi:hypothetical protein
MDGTVDRHTLYKGACPSVRFVFSFLIQTSIASGRVRQSSASSKIYIKIVSQVSQTSNKENWPSAARPIPSLSEGLRNNRLFADHRAGSCIYFEN